MSTSVDAVGSHLSPSLPTTTPSSYNSLTKKRRKSYIEEEDIVVKPSTELIPDEYEHFSNDTVLMHIFRARQDDYFDEDLMDTMLGIKYEITPDANLHYLDEKTSFFNDLKSIKNELENKSALIIIFIGFFKKDGCLFVTDESEAPDTNIHIRDVWNMFSANNCPELKDKPKMFLFCTSPPSVPRIQSDTVRHHTMHFDKVYDFPAESDILIVYMKTDGNSTLHTKAESIPFLVSKPAFETQEWYFCRYLYTILLTISHLNELKHKSCVLLIVNIIDTTQTVKTDFIRRLCRNIQLYSKKHDIIDLVSHMQKHVPLLISTLTRKFYLVPSGEREHYLSIEENNHILDQRLRIIKESVEKLHLMQKKKKEKKFSFSFKRKSEDKPKIVKKDEKSKKTEKPKSVESPRFSASSPSPIGRRSRNQSETDNSERKTSMSLSPTKKKPSWRP